MRIKLLILGAVRGSASSQLLLRRPPQWLNRTAELGEFATELIELYDACVKLEKNNFTNAPSNTNVKHAGHGILVQSVSMAIERDSRISGNKMVITRVEQRSAARHAIQAAETYKDVVMVGDPGTGKTRGTMFFTMQKLMAQGKTVIRVGFKENQPAL